MNLEPKSFTNVDPYAEGPPCQTRGCGHEWFEHALAENYNGEEEEGHCHYCPCRKYREEPLERDEAEAYDY